MRNRVIVIGASADGIQAISRVLHDLPADFTAPVLIVQHIGRRVPRYLPEILARTTRLPVEHPYDGELIASGHVYVAPPDHHMLIRSGAIRLSHGPRENYARPAVDVLFRSAAIALGAQVVGVILTGYLHDGAAGLLAIKERGGVSIVQDPTDAAVPDMPRHALAMAPIDYVCKLSEIGPLLVELVAGASAPRRGGTRGALPLAHERPARHPVPGARPARSLDRRRQERQPRRADPEPVGRRGPRTRRVRAHG